MALVAKLDIVTTASMGGLQKSFSQGAASIEGFGKKLFGINVASNMASAAIGKIGGATTQAAKSMFGFIGDSIAGIASTNKLAASLGLSASTLVGWKDRAQEAGMAGDEFTNRLTKMNDSVGAALSGTKTSQDAFAALGISMDQLKGASTEERMNLIADSIQRLGFNAQNAAALADIFGRQAGPDMLQFLDQGSEGLRKSIEEQKRFGKAWDPLQGATVEEAAKAMKDLGDIIEGVGVQLAIKLSPYLAVFSDWLVDSATKGSTLGNTLSSTFSFLGDAFMATVKGIISGAQGAYIAFKTLQLGVTGVITGIVSAMATLFEAVDSLLPDNFKTGFGESFRGMADELVRATLSLNDELNGAMSSSWADKFQAGVDAGLASVDKASQELAARRENARGLGSLSEGMKPAAIKETPQVAAAMRGSVEAYSAALKAEKAMRGAGDPTFKIQQQHLAVAQDQVKVLGEIRGELKGGLQLAPAGI